jgi:xanthine dehydrogenase accessory factor
LVERRTGRGKIAVLVRGGGEMATGVVHRLARSGFRVCITEILAPLAVRREVAFCEAVFDGQKEVEGIITRRVADEKEARWAWDKGMIPLLVDPECKIREAVKPQVLVDAIMAKKNLGTCRGDAPLVIGLGPGFHAGKDVHLVVETNRGHNLGRVIEEGEAEPDTGVPGEIGGYSRERVLRAPGSGRFFGNKKIGDPVRKGEVIARVEGALVEAGIDGVLRGILRDGHSVHQGMKVGDIDPREIRAHCFTISDKARAIGGGVLEAVLMGYSNFRR